METHQSEFKELLTAIISLSKKYIQKPNVESLLQQAFDQSDKDIYQLSESFISLLKLISFGAPGTFKFLGVEISQSNVRYQSGVFLFQRHPHPPIHHWSLRDSD